MQRIEEKAEISNYSDTFLAPPAAALEKEGDCARTPRAPARGLRPPAPPAESLRKLRDENILKLILLDQNTSIDFSQATRILLTTQER